MANSIELDFADGRYVFRLTWDGLGEVERASRCPFTTIVQHLANGRYSQVNLLEIIRQGLMGGYGTVDGQFVAVGPEVADSLIAHYVTGETGLSEQQIANLATCIAFAAYFGHNPKMLEAAQ